jgi:hypothetical protein
MRGLLREWYNLSRKTMFQISMIALLVCLCLIFQSFAPIDGVVNILLKILGYRSDNILLINIENPVFFLFSVLYWLSIVCILYFLFMAGWNLIDALHRNLHIIPVDLSRKRSSSSNKLASNDRWLSDIVAEETKKHPHQSRLRNWFQINRPSWATVIIAICLFVVFISVSFLSSVWCSHKFLIDDVDLKDYY